MFILTRRPWKNDPKIRISTNTRLAIVEKFNLTDLLTDYINVRQIVIDDNGSYTVERVKKQLYEEVFRFWTSEWIDNDPPVLRGRTFSDVATEVGKLRQDHPGSKRGRDGKINRARRSGQPVYYKLTLNEKGKCLQLTCCDKNSSSVDEAYVDSKEKLADWEFLYRAVRYYDHRERTRVTEYNTAQIIQAARRRIVKWAKNGSDGKDICLLTAAEDRVRDFEPLLLAKDFLARTT
ncbi:hypothetical protein FSARC_8693 [Fusarium sarcochroum]|uniref:Uncharacterized protein n=1 Tax=Fusarium sarcochroum TaxID=1208366 RepID=A0A8H4TSE5_9HYPO|nr:hypothetical protein FSARC_8693 [Fusarium sarcochroum]